MHGYVNCQFIVVFAFLVLLLFVLYPLFTRDTETVVSTAFKNEDLVSDAVQCIYCHGDVGETTTVSISIPNFTARPNALLTVFDYRRTQSIMTGSVDLSGCFGEIIAGYDGVCRPAYRPSTKASSIENETFSGLFDPSNPETMVASMYADFVDVASKYVLNTNAFYPVDFAGFGRENEQHNYHFAYRLTYVRAKGTDKCRNVTRIKADDCVAIYVDYNVNVYSTCSAGEWRSINYERLLESVDYAIPGDWYVVEVYGLSRKAKTPFLLIEDCAELMHVECSTTEREQQCRACEDATVDCPPPRLCHTTACVDGECVEMDSPDGTYCGQETECSEEVCLSGECVTVPTNIGDTCHGDGELFSMLPCVKPVCNSFGKCVPVDNSANATCTVPEGTPMGQCKESACVRGQCVPRALPNGTPCSVKNECGNGTCVDGDCLIDPVEDYTPCSSAFYEMKGALTDLSCLLEVCISGKCMTMPAKDGETCVLVTECGSGVCKNGTCRLLEFHDGTPCSQVVGYKSPLNSVECVESLCYQGDCLALAMADGSACRYNSTCGTGMCLSGNCVIKPYKDGTPCDLDSLFPHIDEYLSPNCTNTTCYGGKCLPVAVNEGAECMLCSDIYLPCYTGGRCSHGKCLPHPMDDGVKCEGGFCKNGVCDKTCALTENITGILDYDYACVPQCNDTSECLEASSNNTCERRLCVENACKVVTRLTAYEPCAPGKICFPDGQCKPGCSYVGVSCSDVPDDPYDCVIPMCSVYHDCVAYNLGNGTWCKDGTTGVDGYCYDGVCKPNACNVDCADFRGNETLPPVSLCSRRKCVDHDCVPELIADYTPCAIPLDVSEEAGYCYDGECVTTCMPEGWTRCHMPGESPVEYRACSPSTCLAGRCVVLTYGQGTPCYYSNGTVYASECDENGVCAPPR